MTRYADMTKEEFVQAHATSFVCEAGKRRIAGVLSTDGISIWPVGRDQQHNGRLTVSVRSILEGIYDRFITQVAA